VISGPARQFALDPRRARWALCGVLLVVGLHALAARSQPAAPAGWVCRYCPFEAGSVSEWSLGTGYVSDDSGKFGDYTGLDEQGFHALVDGTWRSWTESGDYWQLRADNIGLESRSVALDGGRPGRFRVRLRYDELPHYPIDAAVTPFDGTGRLVLPASWVAAGTTTGMTALPQSLKPVDLAQHRKTFGAALDWHPGRALDYRASFSREQRSGAQLAAGSFAALSAWLPAPIDYVTDELDLAVSRAWSNGTLEVGYLGSRFDSNAPTLEWQNPFTPLAPGADFGRLALAPDNQSRQLRASGSYHRGPVYVSASLADGRLEQDDVFAAFSINPAFADLPLPRRSLAGEVDTRRLNLAMVMQASGRLRLSARYDRNERDNNTAQALYEYILTDLAPASPRINIPYGFDRVDTTLKADYRLPRNMRLNVGVERDSHERTFQARTRSEENSVWAKLSLRRLRWVDLTVGWTVRDRDGSDYRAVDLGGRPQNSLMRQYHLADREQRLGEIELSMTPHERVGLLLRAERAQDHYPSSELGLTSGSSRSLSFDVTLDLPRDIATYVSLGRQDVEFGQAGSQGYARPDWSAETDDSTRTRTLGFSKQLLDDRVSLDVDLTNVHSRGETRVIAGVPVTGFPDFTSELDGLNVGVGYAVNDTLKVRAGYRLERYSTDDWQLDGIGPATMSSVLSVGAMSPNYDIDMLTVSFVYTPRAD